MGHTALIRGCLNYNFEIIKLLLARGADMYIIDKDGLSFLDYLNEDCKIELKAYLVTILCDIKPAKY
jgi:ankyrin repeat protein